MVFPWPGQHDGILATAAMARTPAIACRPRATAAVLGGFLAAALPLLQTAGLRAAAATPAADVFPPPETFRSLRLLTLACGRDNTAEPCDQARAVADPLLDHPRLPASCKDALWEIRQRARVAPTNSFQRRDPIDKAAEDVKAFCRQQEVKTTEKKEGSPEGGAGRFGLIAPPQN
jgi:hypothetical protein